MAPTWATSRQHFVSVSGLYVALYSLVTMAMNDSRRYETCNFYDELILLLFVPLHERSLLLFVACLAAFLVTGPRVERVMGSAGFAIYIFIVPLATNAAWLLISHATYGLLGGRNPQVGAWAVVEAILIAQCFLWGPGAVVWPLPQPTDAAAVASPSRSLWRLWVASLRACTLPSLFALGVALPADVLEGLGILTGCSHKTGFRVELCLLSAVLSWAFLYFSWRDEDGVTSFPLDAIVDLPPLPRRAEAALRGLTGRIPAPRRPVGSGGGGAGAGITPVLFSTGSPTGGQVVLPGSTPEEAAHRRAVALEALSQRLLEQQQQQQTRGAAAAEQPTDSDDKKEEAVGA